MLREMGKRGQGLAGAILGEALQDDAPYHVALCDREVFGRGAEGVHEALMDERQCFIHSFYRLSQNKLVILQKTKESGMEQEDFDIRNQQPVTSRERDFENALRPLNFEDFSGQDKVVDNLRIFVKAARLRGEALDHVLLHGPPGLGKTTLSNIIANELGVGFKITSGPVLDKPGDLAGVLTSLEPNDVLFIDEIHRLSPVVEEYLYSAMEDYRIDIMIDKGPSARSIQIDLNPFTLVGATTRSVC